MKIMYYLDGFYTDTLYCKSENYADIEHYLKTMCMRINNVYIHRESYEPVCEWTKIIMEI